MYLNVFDRVEDAHTPSAVTVMIWEMDGQTVAEVKWPVLVENGELIGPALGDPIPVPAALNSAIDALKRYRFQRIVIQIDDVALWDRAWGTLRS
jgi:hypothetical protein